MSKTESIAECESAIAKAELERKEKEALWSSPDALKVKMYLSDLLSVQPPILSDTALNFELASIHDRINDWGRWAQSL